MAFVFTTSAFAARDIEIHESVNNGSAQAHQLMVKKVQEVNDIATGKPQLNQYERAALIHESSKNGHSPAHQYLAEQHKKMIVTGHRTNKSVVAESFKDMNEHEQAR